MFPPGGGPTISGSISVVENRIYSVQIELLMTDLDAASEYASITLGSTNFGTCADCTSCGTSQCTSCNYLTCDSLDHSTITTTSATLSVLIQYTPDVDACTCNLNGNGITAAARITLTPGN